MIKPKQKVVIVGAGPGGLAAAILLQRSGVNVTVVERRIVGGRTSTIERNGFKFDTGPTFFLYPRVLREILAVAGRNLEQEIPMYRLDPQYRLVFGSGGELARIAEDLGARVLLNEPVEEMVFKGRKCTAVRTANRTLAADAVVVNADFAQAMQRMVPNSIRRRWTGYQDREEALLLLHLHAVPGHPRALRRRLSSGLKIWTASIWLAAAPILVAACR